MARGGKLLLVDDDAELAAPVAEYLEGQGHRVQVASNLTDARAALLPEAPDLVLLDLTLGHETGLTLLRELSEADVAVIVVTGQVGSMERIVSLEMGAADVVEKPFDLRELAIRVAGVLRRRTRDDQGMVQLDRVRVDLRAALVLQPDGQLRRLSHGQVALLRALLARPGEALSREALLEAAPTGDDATDARSIDQRVARLRALLDTGLIETLRGHGYRLNLPPPPA